MVYAPYWWEVRIFKPGEVSEVTLRFQPDGAPNGFSPPRARNLRARRRDDGAPGGRRAGAGGRAGSGGLEGRPRTVRPARSLAADAARRTRRPHVRLRARGKNRRGAHPDAAHGLRRRAHRGRAVRAHSGILRAPVPRNAQHERHDRGDRQPVGRAALRPRRMHPRRAVARASALARRASRAGRRIRRRRPDGRDDPLRGACRLVRFRHRAVGDDILVAPGRRGGGGRARRRAGVRARVHGGGEPCAARVPAPAAIVARLVARGRRDPSGAGTHGRRLPVRPARARARRRPSITRRIAGSAGGSRPKC